MNLSPPLTQKLTNPDGLVNGVWERWFTNLLENPVKVKTESVRVEAGEDVFVLDGTTSIVTLTLPATPKTNRSFSVACIDSTNACSIALNGKTFYSDAGPLSLVAGDYYFLQYDGTRYTGFKGSASGGITDHNLLDNLQGGNGTDEYYHLDAADHTETVAFMDGGTNSHTTVDSHIVDGTIHFTEASIDHENIQNIGTNTHPQIDTHIANTTIHNPYSGLVTVEYDEVVPTFTGNLETSRVYKLATVTVMTLTFTYDTSDRIATVSNGTNTWTYTHSGTGFLSGGVKT